MLPTDRIEEFVRAQDIELVSHNTDHFFRTAKGAAWFVKILNGTREEEEMAYIAGLLHDIVRYNTEEKDHAEASAEKAGEILKGFRVEPERIARIVQAIRNHRKPVEWESPLHQSVYLADKILEQMGSFVIFRRAVWIKENKDYSGVPVQKAFSVQTRKKLSKFNTSVFPERFHRLVDYQFSWHRDFLEHFERREPWALRLIEWCYTEGSKLRNMEEVIRTFRPQSPEEEKHKKEAVDYLDGKKWEEFRKMV